MAMRPVETVKRWFRKARLIAAEVSEPDAVCLKCGVRVKPLGAWRTYADGRTICLPCAVPKV